MKEGPSIAPVAALAGDPARANMLSALLAGKALTASELANEAGVTVQQFSFSDFVAEDLIYGRFDSPGVQTFNFKPYRVDLTPFAGLLSDGAAHTVALSVFNADNYFSTTASLLLYLDHGKKRVTGAVTRNTLVASPVWVAGRGLTRDGPDRRAASARVMGIVSSCKRSKLCSAGRWIRKSGRPCWDGRTAGLRILRRSTTTSS